MRCVWIIILVGLALCLRADAGEIQLLDDAAKREYQVKAAMIANFVQFVEWPKDSFSEKNAPLVIGVLGPNPFGDALERIVAGKQAGGHPIIVRQFAAPTEISDSHALFVPISREGDLQAVFQQIQGQRVLAIGESDSFLPAGGIIRFYTEDNKMRFEINPAAAERLGLKISSKLLKLARIYKK